MTASFRNLTETLVNYTCEMFNEITPQKLATVRLTYEIIREAMSDLHGDNKELAQDAKDYFGGELFQYHCDCVCIDEKTMLRIVNNPDKHVKHIETEFYESNN